MRVEVYTRGHDPLLLWDGELECIPRVGDHITCWDGWCGVTVHAVDYDLFDRTVAITLNTNDPTGEYAKELRRRGRNQGDDDGDE